MQSKAKTVKEYLSELPEDRLAEISKVRKVIIANLPKGYEERMQYGMISYVVPLKTYPRGYAGREDEPLPYLSLASQKNNISLYLMGMWDKKAKGMLIKEFKSGGKKLDMGKCCIRFKKAEDLPLEAIGREIARVSVSGFVKFYEKAWGKR